jgi:acyl-coenzyme A synthetase/AMP-(fatty) acid ligase
MASTLWHRFLQTAQTQGHGMAMVQGSRRTSFAELAAMACAWGRVLQHPDQNYTAQTYAVQPGDRVVIAAHSSVDMAAAVAGIWACGAIPVVVNTDAPDSHLSHAITQTSAVAVFLEPGRSLPQGCCARLHVLAASDQMGLNLVGTHVGLQPDVPPQSEDAPGSIVFTSGSSGLPKGVVQTARTLARGVDRVAQTLGYVPQDILLCPVPFAFDYGWGQLLSVLLRGMPMVLAQPRTASGLCEAIATHSPTVFVGVPAVFADLLSGLAPIQQVDRSCIRLITNTGSRIPSPIFDKLKEVFPQAAVSLNYGLTETYRSASLPINMASSHPHSVGYALPGAVLTVLRPDGTEADPDEEGEIIHRGEGVFLAYWADPQRTAEVRRPDPLWHATLGEDSLAPMAVFTGDLGHKDAEGRLFVHGRRDRQMKSMGVRVSPDEVEGLLLASGLLREVAVVSRPHDMLGDLIVAVIAVPQGEDALVILKALKRHARATMSPYMQPRDHLVLPALPRNANGKVDYPALKRLVLAQE